MNTSLYIVYSYPEQVVTHGWGGVAYVGAHIHVLSDSVTLQASLIQNTVYNDLRCVVYIVLYMLIKRCSFRISK